MRGGGVPDERSFTGDQIRAMQDAAVARLVRYVGEKSPFYRRRFQSEGIRPDAVRAASHLKRIPPTTKADLASGNADFRCVPPDMIADVVTTSGTTGRPVIYPLTQGDIDRLGLNECLSFSCSGLTAADTVLVAVTLDKCFMAGLAYYEGIKRLGAAAVRVGSGSPAMLIDMVERLSATAIVSVPSFLWRVADYAEERGIDLKANSVSRLVCIGEPVRAADFSLNALGRRIADAWGASVASTYGVTEIAGSFCECEEGCGGHVHPSLHYLEILDEAGDEVPAGEAGEIVVTTLGVEALPLIRFRTGDISFMVTERCRCGRRTARIGPILARKNEMLKIKGTTVFPAAVYNVLDSLPWVEDYVLIASTLTALSDRLEVIVALREKEGAGVQAIGEELKGILKVTPAVRVATSVEIAEIRDDASYRKKRRFLDRRASTS